MRWPRGKATAACERASARPEGNMIDWFAATLRSYPEIAIFLALGIGYYAGRFTFRGIGLGAVTSTLLAAVLIGQLGITISPNVKSVFFLMFLFAVGYGVGPQFVRGIAKDGLPQALFAAVVCVFCLGACLLATKLVGYDLGYAAGLYAGSQTISASMGLATDAINRLGLPPEQAKGLLDAMRSEEHTSELQSRLHLVCRLLLEKKKHIKRSLHVVQLRPDLPRPVSELERQL